MKKRKRPKPSDDLQDLFGIVLNFFNGDLGKTLLWFATPNVHLGVGKPIEIYYKRPKKLRAFIEAAVEDRIKLSQTG